MNSHARRDAVNQLVLFVAGGDVSPGKYRLNMRIAINREAAEPDAEPDAAEMWITCHNEHFSKYGSPIMMRTVAALDLHTTLALYQMLHERFGFSGLVTLATPTDEPPPGPAPTGDLFGETRTALRNLYAACGAIRPFKRLPGKPSDEILELSQAYIAAADVLNRMPS